MNKNKTAAYLAGGVSIALCLVVLVFLIMILFGIIVPRKIPLTVVTDSESVRYSGEALTAKDYIYDGMLRDGDKISVFYTGSQTLVGTSDNTAEVTVFDKNGIDVTQRYEIELIPGELTVEPRVLYVKTDGAEKIYDGTPLEGGGGEITQGSLVSGHRATFEPSGSQTDVGTGLNQTKVFITDANGADMTDQYELRYDFGTLRVTPRKLTIRSASAEKTYDGKPLSSASWQIEAGQLCSSHQINVVTGGAQTQIGECENEIVYALIYYDTSDGKQVDVTRNYEIACYYGTLSVRPTK